jgi:Spx/MgsR family transcriptional regulator
VLTVYGLKNCDTCRKAIKWLTAENIPHTFHEVRKDGIDRAMVAGWLKDVRWEVLLNQRGYTWRGLPVADKNGIDETKAIDLMIQNPALIKRPVFDKSGIILVGFKEADKALLVL